MDNPKAGVSSFFSKISNKSKANNVVDTYIYICAKEFGWTQEDFENTEIPYLFAVLSKRQEDFREQERQAKKRR